jgi:hypothetical protein
MALLIGFFLLLTAVSGFLHPDHRPHRPHRFEYRCLQVLYAVDTTPGYRPPPRVSTADRPRENSAFCGAFVLYLAIAVDVFTDFVAGFLTRPVAS